MGSKLRHKRAVKASRWTNPWVTRDGNTASTPTRSSSPDGDSSSSIPNSAVETSPALTERSSQQSDQTYFRFGDLPRDIAVYMLKFMLVAPEGIVNPWMNRGELEKDYPRHTNAHTWRKWLRPSILATCRTFYKLGTPMLHGYNTFRLLHPAPRIRDSTYNYMHFVLDLLRFLGYIHLKLDSGKGHFLDTRSQVSRKELIKHLQIQPSEIDDDALASKGVSRVINNWFLMGTEYTLFLLSALATCRLNLRTLTLTLDEEDKDMLDSIRKATDDCRERHHRANLTRETKVESLIIRGTGPLERENTDNPFTKQVVDWISATEIKPEKVIFSGPFTERRIMEDGFVIPEGVNWQAINTPLPEMSQEELSELLDRTWPWGPSDTLDLLQEGVGALL